MLQQSTSSKKRADSLNNLQCMHKPMPPMQLVYVADWPIAAHIFAVSHCAANLVTCSFSADPPFASQLAPPACAFSQTCFWYLP